MLIPSTILENVAKFASTDETRYVLNGVLVERDADGKPRAVATDGHRLMSVTWNEKSVDVDAVVPAEAQSFGVISADHATNAAKANKGRKGEIGALVLAEVSASVASLKGVTGHGATGVLTPTGNATEVEKINGRFPDYRQVVPTREWLPKSEDNSHYETRVRLNPKYLASACATLAALRCDAMEIGVAVDALSPVSIKGYNLDTGADIAIVIMPMKMNNDQPTVAQERTQFIKVNSPHLRAVA